MVHREAPHVEPMDQHNQKLVANVHPPTWVNPQPRERYHLVVIGAGTGGLVSAAGAAGLGARVALVERYLMGGDCLNVGCVPSKALIRSSRAWQAARDAQPSFSGPSVGDSSDFGAVMERMRRLRATLSHIDGAPRFRDLGVDVFLGHGRFIGPDVLEVEGAQLRFKRAVIATGARASVPPIPGLRGADYLTNETVFSLTELPRRLLVIGAGPIGCELAQTFARLGSRVTVFNRTTQILPREDADAAAVVERAMRRDGVTFVHGSELVGVELSGAERIVVYSQNGGQHRLAGDQILVATGRAANVEDLGLDAAKVSHDHLGVKVDNRLQTTNPRIYAVGDVCSRFKFTHAADFHARTVIANALFFGRGRASRLVIPWATYTSPEVAHVGDYEKEARARGIQVDTLTVPLSEVDRAVLDGEDEGFFRVHLRRGTDRILGATLVADHAGELISEITLAMTAGLGLAKIGQTIHPYPTQAEVFRKAADQWRRGKLTPRVRRILDIFFRVQA